MTDKDFVLTTMRKYGMRRAQDLQETSEGMTGTELYEKEDYIPDLCFRLLSILHWPSEIPQRIIFPSDHLQFLAGFQFQSHIATKRASNALVAPSQ